MSLSHQLPHQGAAGGLKYHSICTAVLCLAIFPQFNALEAPVKLVHYLYIMHGRPRLAVNLRKHFKKPSVDSVEMY